ncbi:hypothetical protein NSK_002119 [Nannochloropsis salina CCMP1776]|uniref:VDE lipocalin domain-containing protein n=1 Tax=Nannochloropsis salina CCMP1776 TaxID=1027361 RepID=A0A4D9D4I3_9STRA|nr:hypothetical protein NSK_002119 [Nannochloropsis salina CCMP1776]|eukprot:TFJ86462.1 hypothetical protein NSK_002119 [Nannochloropsis salina CCMP1776]
MEVFGLMLGGSAFVIPRCSIRVRPRIVSAMTMTMAEKRARISKQYCAFREHDVGDEERKGKRSITQPARLSSETSHTPDIAITIIHHLQSYLPKVVMLILSGGWMGVSGGGLLNGPGPLYPARAENELAQYAKEGNKVGVDPKCFVQKCSLPTHDCLNNPDCLKGLSCLSKCKGEGTCSTACFAKYGNRVLDDFLHCAVEQQDCVHVPRDRSRATWTDPDAVGLDKRSSPTFEIRSLNGRWYKVMGMDARYDCFDCQVNHFTPKPGAPNIMLADVSFRMPRPRAPGFWENHVTEEMLGDGPGARRSMHSVGRMFGLTFWENWYVIGENSPEDVGLPDYKFVFYTGHTLQGNYEGAFVYARTPELPPELMPAVSQVARANGLDPSKFCKIRNTCFRPDSSSFVAASSVRESAGTAHKPGAPPSSWAGVKSWITARALWLPEQISQLVTAMNQELGDWFEDPTTTSDWLIKQQERMVMVTEEAPTGRVQVIASRPGIAAGDADSSAKTAGPAPPVNAATITASTAQLEKGQSSSTDRGGFLPAFIDILAEKIPQ